MDSVLLVEGHRQMRSALKALIAASGFAEVVEAIDPIEAIVKTNLLAPRLIVLETTWQQMNGMYLSRMLRELAPQSNIVLLVDEEWEMDADAQIASGANACIAKNVLLDQLPRALEKWRNGNSQDGTEK
ncbi:MAG: response regulator [Chloroflexi bacterium]|nr:response regulator [Chloroflexota bacterium]